MANRYEQLIGQLNLAAHLPTDLSCSSATRCHRIRKPGSSICLDNKTQQTAKGIKQQHNILLFFNAYNTFRCLKGELCYEQKNQTWIVINEKKVPSVVSTPRASTICWPDPGWALRRLRCVSTSSSAASQKMTVRSVVTLRTFMMKVMNHKMNIHQLPHQRRKEENWI